MEIPWGKEGQGHPSSPPETGKLEIIHKNKKNPTKKPLIKIKCFLHSGRQHSLLCLQPSLAACLGAEDTGWQSGTKGNSKNGHHSLVSPPTRPLCQSALKGRVAQRAVSCQDGGHPLVPPYQGPSANQHPGTEQPAVRLAAASLCLLPPRASLPISTDRWDCWSTSTKCP